jgi:beta-fructofuranosidase
VTWTEQPIALAPGDGDDGIWSGSLALDGDDARTFYTSVQQPDISIGRVRTATPGDRAWREWTKNDIVVEAPAELDLVAFRDPFVFKHEDQWRMLVGAGLANGVAAAASFVSDDLRHWTYTGLAAQRSGDDHDPVWTGTVWECPQIFAIDGRHVLVTSVWDNETLHYAAYGVGTFTDGQFHAESWGRLTYGDSYYAPSFFRDRVGRPSLIFWMRGHLDEHSGRAGALSIPHLLRLEGDRLVTEPHPDLLRYAQSDSNPGRRPATSAYLLQWSPEPGESLVIEEDGQCALHLSRETEGLRIEQGGRERLVPTVTGTVSVVLDGAVTEIFTSAGSFGIGGSATPVEWLQIKGNAAVSVLARASGTAPAARRHSSA